jgi:hypothetical protein
VTAFGMIAGKICGRRQSHVVKKTGKEAAFFVVAVEMGGKIEFWNVVAFADDLRAIVAGLRDGAPISVAGSFTVSVGEWRSQQRLNFRLKADQILALGASRAEAATGGRDAA